MNNQPVSFPTWKDALSRSNLPPATKIAYCREVIAFLKHCKVQHTPATVGLAKRYLDHHEANAAGHSREALRWFFRTAWGLPSQNPPVVSPTRAAPIVGPLRPMEPPPAAQDLGGPEWEKVLIQTMRLRGLLWRTEDTYRSWSRRFAAFIAPRTPYAASGVDVGAFLTDLAVRTRASPSGQRQALNALVFLMQEALGRDLGKLDFKRATPRQRVPIVLSRDECRRIFTQLEGTNRLMAELAYGSGLRLMELLRLRVQHVDLERMQLIVRGGKGDKDRVYGFADAARRQ